MSTVKKKVKKKANMFAIEHKGQQNRSHINRFKTVKKNILSQLKTKSSVDEEMLKSFSRFNSLVFHATSKKAMKKKSASRIVSKMHQKILKKQRGEEV